MQINSGSLITASKGPFMTAYKFIETASWFPLSESVSKINGVNNLMVNGDCFLGTTYNINSEYVVADNTAPTPNVFWDRSNRIDWGSVYVPIDTSQTYSYSMWAKSSGSVASYSLIGYSSIDKSGNFIPLHYLGGIGDTWLSKSLNDGDLTASLSSSTGWAATTDPSHAKYLLIYSASSADYYTPWTYTRFVGTYVSRSGNEIYFSSPWAGGSVVAGTPISNGQAGGSYNYLFYGTFPTSWTYYSALCYGEGRSSGAQFRYGTKYLLFFNYANYGGGDGIRFTNVIVGNVDNVNDGNPYNKHMSISSQNTVMCSGLNEL